MLTKNPSNTIVLIDPSKGNPAPAPTDQQRTRQRSPFKVAAFCALTFISIMLAIFYSSTILSRSDSSDNAGIPSNVSKLAEVTSDNSCGFQDGNSIVCPKALPCCSQYGWCGSTDAYCVNQNMTFSYSEPVGNWTTCENPISDICADSSFTCCVAPADVSTKKFTCRPKNITSECAIFPITNYTSLVVPASSGVASAVASQSSTPAASVPVSVPVSAPVSAPASVPASAPAIVPASVPVVSSVVSSSSSGNMWVTPYQIGNGYTPENWPNPGGCTGTTEILRRAFPTGDILFWTGEQKNEAIKMIAAQYSYRLIASAFAPDTCFRVATLVSTAGVSVQAIVLDFSHVYFSQNVGDVSQAVIDILGGVPDSGHIDIQSISYSEVQTFPKPPGFP